VVAGGDAEALGGLLQDLEEGYTKRVAFVIPPGAVWPLPLYEIALMTAREVWGIGVDGAELTVITPEAVPLALFGSAAAAALREELDGVGIHLESATVARVHPGHHVQIVLQPSVRRLEVDRVVALPASRGRAYRGQRRTMPDSSSWAPTVRCVAATVSGRRATRSRTR
jgi:sulfide:quinone oxidoreductase